LKKLTGIFLLTFYAFGIFCLPSGDFSMLSDLPAMYLHCKATEDNDMTTIYIITDHLVNINGIFDKHDNGEHQKPHTPNPSHRQGQTQILALDCISFSIAQFYPVNVKPLKLLVSFLPSDYFSKIFHPPIG
jgi:hypothetical protein